MLFNDYIVVAYLCCYQELLDTAMQTLLQTIEWERDPREQRNLQLKKQTLEEELTMLRQRLADASKVRHRHTSSTYAKVHRHSLSSSSMILYFELNHSDIHSSASCNDFSFHSMSRILKRRRLRMPRSRTRLSCCAREFTA